MDLTRKRGIQEEVPEGETCVFLRRIVGMYKAAIYAEDMGNVFDAYVNYSKCYEMLNSFIMLAPARARMIPPAKCMQTCGTDDRTCNVAYFMDMVRKRAEDLQQKMAPSVEKLVLSVSSTTSSSESDEIFACQSLKLPSGSDKLCETWFDDIIGLQDAKERLTEGFIYPLLYPNLYGAVSGGVLLYGPPGTGKTMLARALINELEDMSRHPTTNSRCSRFLYFAPTTDMLKGKYVGETEKKITDLFMGASKLACKVASAQGVNVISMIFIDEVDGLAPSRDAEGAQAQIISSAVNTLLQMMDGVNAPRNVVVLAATNYPDSLDSAFRRRFQYQIPIDLPTQADIEEQIGLLLSKHASKYTTYEDMVKNRRCKPIIGGGGGTNAFECANKAIESQGCERTDRLSVRSSDWLDPSRVYSQYVGARLTPEYIKRLAKECHAQHYSGSDIARLFNAVIKLSATAALKAGIFFPMDGKYISINCFKGNTPSNVTPKFVGQRMPDSLKTFNINGTDYINRLDHYQNVFGLPAGADEMYVAVSGSSANFIIRYSFKVRSLPGKMFSLFARTKVITSSTVESSAFWRWLKGIYTPEEVSKSIETGVIGDSSKILDGDFWVWDMAADTLTFAKVPIDLFMWDRTAMRDVISRKELMNLAPLSDDKADSEKIMDTIMNVVTAYNEDNMYVFGTGGSLEYSYLETMIGAGDDGITRYYTTGISKFALTKHVPSSSTSMEIVGSCEDWLRANSEYVNWDMNALYFTRAKLSSKSTIDGSEKTKEQYQKFKKYIQTV